MSCQESLMEHYHDTPNLDFDFNFIVGNNFIFEYRGFDLTTCEKILTWLWMIYLIIQFISADLYDSLSILVMGEISESNNVAKFFEYAKNLGKLSEKHELFSRT